MYNGRRMIALCISRANDKRNVDMIASLNRAANHLGYKLLVYHTCSDLYHRTPYEEGEKTVFDLMDFTILDAVIVMEEAFYDKPMLHRINARAKQANVPLISIGGNTDIDGIRFLFGYVEGFEQVVRHLVEFHRISNIIMVAGERGEVYSERRIGAFRRVLEENDIPYDDSLVLYGDYWQKPTEIEMEKQIAAGRIPQAVVCANDSMAVAVCNVLQKHGYRVPGDVLVAGFDGSEQAKISLPRLTTSGCNYTKAAEHMMDVLKRLFAGEEVGQQYKIPYEIEICTSCGCHNKDTHINSGLLLNETSDHFFQYQESERLLYEISSQISYCERPQDVVAELAKYKSEPLAVFVNQDVFDETVNPTDVRDHNFDEQMYLLYRTGERFPLEMFPLKMDRREQLAVMSDFMDSENPLIFSALSFGENPLGYLCFCYDTDKKVYDFITQQSNSFNHALSSFRALRYTRYVTRTIEDISRLDSMTGLYNRKGFFEKLPELLQSASPSSYVCVVSMDLDGLKYINDCYGHQNGDFAICTAADALAGVRMGERFIAARFGGDEMVMCCVTEDVECTKQQIRQEIYAHLAYVNRTAGKPFTLSASVGISAAPAAEFRFDEILKLSDIKMYQEKREKPNHR